MAKKSKRPKKSDRLSEYWSHQRKMLNDLLLESDDYQESIVKGLPFFTANELAKLKKKYSTGITWPEIEAELSKKGMIFKQATFRKYIQEKKIPSAYRYRATNKGREALYPSETMDHINFIQYLYRIADNELVDKLIDIFTEQKISVKDAIEEQLCGWSLLEGVFMYLRDMSDWENDIKKAICDVLNHDPELMKKANDGLNEIYDVFHDKFNEWVKMLQNHEIPISDKD
jgi:hypothetical protein